MRGGEPGRGGVPCTRPSGRQSARPRRWEQAALAGADLGISELLHMPTSANDCRWCRRGAIGRHHDVGRAEHASASVKSALGSSDTTREQAAGFQGLSGARPGDLWRLVADLFNFPENLRAAAFAAGRPHWAGACWLSAKLVHLSWPWPTAHEHPCPAAGSFSTSEDHEASLRGTRGRMDAEEEPLCRFFVYQTAQRLYLVGTSKSQHVWRVLRFSREAPEPGGGAPVTEDPHRYSQQQMTALLRQLHSGACTWVARLTSRPSHLRTLSLSLSARLTAACDCRPRRAPHPCRRQPPARRAAAGVPGLRRDRML